MGNPAEKPLDGMGLAVVNQIINARLTEIGAAKQNTLRGAPGQVVGFDAGGHAVAQDAPTGGGGIPAGGIIIWSGAANQVPSGWALCNGENGTPDLRDKFVLGAGTKYAAGSVGGEENHTLTISEMPKHSHSFNISRDQVGGSTGYGFRFNSGIPTGLLNISVSYSGSGNPHNNMPPYYALAYIMKL